ncbi:MAG: hypothetical protein Q3Y13_05165, partial [Sutterella sp.]|nr:hypothetical protein [Sutterella sp.]
MTTKKNKTAVVDPTDLDVNLLPQDADWASLSAEADMDALGFPEDDLGPIGAPDDAAFGLDDFPEAFPAFGGVPAEGFGAGTAAVVGVWGGGACRTGGGGAPEGRKREMARILGTGNAD